MTLLLQVTIVRASESDGVVDVSLEDHLVKDSGLNDGLSEVHCTRMTYPACMGNHHYYHPFKQTEQPSASLTKMKVM